jgi:hypothetical protein
MMKGKVDENRTFLSPNNDVFTPKIVILFLKMGLKGYEAQTSKLGPAIKMGHARKFLQFFHP